MEPLCYKITATLTAVTPLHLGSGQRTGVIKRTFGFIPGSTLRGAVGTSLIKAVCRLSRPLVNHEECKYFGDCPYVQLFGEEFGKASNVFFRYAYPLHLKCGGTFQPAPKTLFVCKNPQCRKVYDQIVPPVKCEEAKCRENLEPMRGYVCSSCHEACEQPIGFSRTISTAVDRGKMSAAQVEGTSEKYGTLHVVETVRKGSKFAVEVLVSRDACEHVKLLKSTLERGLEDEGIGGGKSRGLGKVRVEETKIIEVSEEFIKKRALEIDSLRFSVRFVSPALVEGSFEASALLEACRRSYTWLFHEGKPSLPEAKLTAARAEYETFCGWSLKTQKRRRVEPAVSAGSIFQFESKNGSELFALSLAALELHAVGSYKPHGCGQMLVESIR